MNLHDWGRSMKKQKMFMVISFLILAMLGTATVAEAQDDIREHRHCAHCGMDRKAYGYSRMVVHYEDGTAVGVCSLHCAVVEMDGNPARKLKFIEAADRDTRSLVNAEQAYWVIGGKKRGVMTQRPKWAFGTKSAAGAFISENGGQLAAWAEALAAAKENLPRKPR